jgi:hypothetical protein
LACAVAAASIKTVKIAKAEKRRIIFSPLKRIRHQNPAHKKSAGTFLF